MYSENPPNHPNRPGFPQQTPYQGNYPMYPQPAPNSTSVLILGISSIITACCCYGIVGVILGIIALPMAKKGQAAYRANPALYTPGSLSNIQIGRTCAIIGLIVGLLFFVIYLFIIFLFGFQTLTNPNQLSDLMRNA